MSWDSKRGRIVEAVVNRLKAMTVAGGYHWDIKATSVYSDPVNLLNVPEPELPALSVEPSAGSRYEFHPANQMEDYFVLLITGRVTANGLAVERKHQAAENLLMDLEKTLTVDITLGGLLFDLRLRSPEPPLAEMGNGNNVIVLQELECHHHRTYGAP